MLGDVVSVEVDGGVEGVTPQDSNHSPVITWKPGGFGAIIISQRDAHPFRKAHHVLQKQCRRLAQLCAQRTVADHFICLKLERKAVGNR